MSCLHQPHALLFPYPAQGHINPMMQLAIRLLDTGFFVTFVNTDYNYERMFGRGAADAPISPSLRFKHLPDGLPDWHQRFNQKPAGIIEITIAILALSGPMAELVRRVSDSPNSPPLTCIISDSFCSWVQDVADIFRLPRVCLWTTPVHGNLAYEFMPSLHSQGIIPLKEKSKLLDIVHCIEGIVPMQLQDYISFFLTDSEADFLFQWFLRLGMKRSRDAIWNLGNNFEAMEPESSSAFKKEVPNFLPIGPLLPFDVGNGDGQSRISSGRGVISLWPEDPICHDWLSQHEHASVIYLSFGSIADVSEEDVAEIIMGIQESGYPFLWAIRPDQEGGAVARLREKLNTEAAEGKPSRRGLLVSWAPQLAVLRHPSVGLFISHCGWNSVTEAVAGGVPILAKPSGFAEQNMNAHYIAEVWKIGRLLPKGSTAKDVNLLVSSMMEDCKEAGRTRERVLAMKESALAAVSAGGSSLLNFELFVDDMRRRAAADCSQKLDEAKSTKSFE